MKKIAFLCMASLILTLVQIPVSATEQVSISGIPQTTETLTAEHTLSGSNITYQWQVAENGGEYKDIAGATEQTLLVTNDIASRSESVARKIVANRYTPITRTVRVIVGCDGTEYTSPPITMEQAMGPLARIENLSTMIGWQLPVRNERAPEQYVFRVADSDKRFILLEDQGDDGYYVLTQDYYGTHAFDASYTGGTGGKGKQKFDPENENNIAYWLNHDFLENGNGEGNQLPASIREHLQLRAYKTEAGSNRVDGLSSTSDIPNDYWVNARVALLSQTELMQYSDRIGVLEDKAWVDSTDKTQPIGWHLRSVRGVNPQTLYDNFFVIWSNNKKYHTETSLLNSEKYVRPSFFLDKDFFKTVAVDLDSLSDGSHGESNVIRELLWELGREELKAGGAYSDAEIDRLFANRPALVTGTPTISYEYLEIGQTLIPNYHFVPAPGVDPDDVLANTDNSAIQWQASKDGEVWTDIASVGKELTVTNQLGGQYIRFVVKPRDARPEAVSGTAVISQPTGRLPAALGPVSAGKVVNTPLQTTPDAHVFYLDMNGADGQRGFILLDYDEADGYFVLTKDFYGTVVYATDRKMKFNPDNAENIAYWVNHNIQNGAYGVTLPAAIAAGVDERHRWVCESTNAANAAAEGINNDFTVVSGISLLSQSELARYGEKIGLIDGLTASDAGWWLRSPNKLYVNCTNLGSTVSESTSPVIKKSIRPAFYLQHDFFAEHRLDLRRTGSAVIARLKENYDKKQLSALYSAEELQVYFGYSDIMWENVSVTNGTEALTAANLKTAETVQLSADIVCTEGSYSGLIAMLSVYDKENRLIAIRAQQMDQLTAQSPAEVAMTLTGWTAGEAAHVQVVLWNGLKKLDAMVRSIDL